MTIIKHFISKRLLGAAIAATALILPTLAFAQEAPPYAQDAPPYAQDAPPYTQDAPPYDEGGASTQIQGTIVAINGTWNITVHDANGYADSVALHQGTIINPTGLTLEPGMSVTIDGYADGPNFDALEIDTPYQYQGPAPVAVYYGPGAWYPGYAYGWGPSFSLAFDFGSRSFRQRSFYFGGQIRRPMAPPSGWQNRPHGYIGGGFNSRSRSAYAAPQRNYAAPQQQYRGYSQPQQQYRGYAQPQQQYRGYSAPRQQYRGNAAPQQQYRGYSAPQQQYRGYSAPQQQYRGNSAPQQQVRRYAAPQARGYAAPQSRSYAAPQARSYAAPASRGGRNSNNDQRHR